MTSWRDVLADVEAQAEALAQADLDLEVADRTRRELAGVGLAGRLAAAVGGPPLDVGLLGGARWAGVPVGAGPDWLLLAVGPGTEVLVAGQAVVDVVGLGPRSRDDASIVRARLDLAWAVRRLAVQREAVRVLTVDGLERVGTIDRVGRDHLDLAEHPLDAPRRGAEVRGHRLLALRQVAALVRG